MFSNGVSEKKEILPALPIYCCALKLMLKKIKIILIIQ